MLSIKFSYWYKWKDPRYPWRNHYEKSVDFAGYVVIRTILKGIFKNFPLTNPVLSPVIVMRDENIEKNLLEIKCGSENTLAKRYWFIFILFILSLMLTATEKILFTIKIAVKC